MSDLGNQFYVELNNLLVPECDKAGANPVYAFYRLHDSGDVELPQIITRRATPAESSFWALRPSRCSAV